MTAEAAAAQPAALTGLHRDEHHWYFYGDTGPLPSVTNIIKVLDRSGPLVGWAKRETAACAVRNLDLLTQLVATGGQEQAAEWLRGIPDYIRDESAKLGNRVHAIADGLARGEAIPYDPVAEPYVTAYQRFLAHMNPKLLSTETLVCNLTEGYGGTLDIAAEFPGDGAATLIDIKTGREVYAETALQFTGYAHGEFTAAADDPTQIALPAFGQFGVLHLREDRTWSLVPYEVGPDEWDAFRACLRLYSWNRHNAPFVKGRPYQEQQP